MLYLRGEINLAMTSQQSLLNAFLKGAQIYLRPLTRGDLEGPYFDWLNDQTVTRFLDSGRFPNSPERMEEFYKLHANGSSAMVLAIVLMENNKHVGNIRLHQIDYVHRSAEVGIFVGDVSAWGRGIATEAIQLLSGHAFNKLNLNRLAAGAVLDNRGSIRAFEKAGFQSEGISRQVFWNEGRYWDGMRLSLLREDWSQQEQTNGAFKAKEDSLCSPKCVRD